MAAGPEGDSRTVGIQYLLDQGAELYRVRHSFVWPGEAGIIASFVIYSSVPTRLARYLGEKQVDTINDTDRKKRASFDREDGAS